MIPQETCVAMWEEEIPRRLRRRTSRSLGGYNLQKFQLVTLCTSARGSSAGVG